MTPEPTPEPRANPSMKDIAQKAGVAVSTVSYALKNHPKISRDRRVQIQQIAKEMGYRPDAYISTLMARVHNRGSKSEQAVLGLLVETGIIALMDAVPYHRDWFRGMHQRAEELGYKIDIFQWSVESRPAKTLAKALHTRGIRGIMVAPNLQQSASIDFPFEGFACATVGASLRHPDLHRVNTHYSLGMDIAFQKLIERGYRRPGLVLPRPFDKHIRSGFLGPFLACQLLASEIEAIPPCLTEGYFGFEQQVAKWFQAHQPDVLLTVNPKIVLHGLRDLTSVPDRVALIDLTRDEPNNLTGLSQSGEEEGAALVEIVIAQIHNGESGVPVNARHTLLPGKWIEGGSLPYKK